MIVRSPYPDVEIPGRSFPEHVFRRVAQWGDRPALIDAANGRILTFRRLDDSVRRAANGLLSLGFRRGDVVAVYAPNLPDYAVAVHAVLRLGGICTTINPRYTADELALQLEDAHARYLITDGASLEKAHKAAQKVGLGSLLSFDEDGDVMPFSRLLEAEPIADDYPHPDPASLAVLPYSSGTTGWPKGVMLTHSNLVANMSQYDGCLDVGRPTDEDTIIAVLPFFHIYGFRLYLGSALSHGATLVTVARFEINTFLQTIQEFQITRLYAVPPILLAVVNCREAWDYDLSSLRHIVCGAAPLDEGLARAAMKRLKCTLVQGYGLTETSPLTHFGRDRGKFAGKIGSVGVCAPNTEAKVIDCGTGLDLGVGQRGELLVRGPQVMQGYLARPAETAAAIDGDGWLHTGDVAYFDEDGDFFVVDRVKELIKYKGLQVAPAELEALLLSHPEVMDAAVIPSPDGEAGEVPVAYVVAREALDAEEVMSFVASRVAPHKRIRRVECVAEIPKSPSGKILRRLLVERERDRWQGRGRASAVDDAG